MQQHTWDWVLVPQEVSAMQCIDLPCPSAPVHDLSEDAMHQHKWDWADATCDAMLASTGDNPSGLPIAAGLASKDGLWQRKWNWADEALDAILASAGDNPMGLPFSAGLELHKSKEEPLKEERLEVIVVALTGDELMRERFPPSTAVAKLCLQLEDAAGPMRRARIIYGNCELPREQMLSDISFEHGQVLQAIFEAKKDPDPAALESSQCGIDWIERHGFDSVVDSLDLIKFEGRVRPW